MKKFILKILLFSIFLLIINVIFKDIMDRIYFNEYYQIDVEKEHYLLADSHGGVIGSFENEKIYNFSNGGDSYLDMKNKLNFLINYTKVRTIIITADDHTLSPYRETSNNSDRSAFFKSREDFPNYVEFIKEKYFFPNLVLLEPKYGVLLNNYFKSFVLPSLQTDKSWNMLSERVKKQKSLDRFKDQFVYAKPSPILEKELLEIIKISKENGIEIIGIKFPLSKQYKEVLGAKSFYADSLLLKNKIKIYNFNNLNFENDEFFHDQDHLNETGAKVFKKIFIDSIFHSI